MYLFSKTNYKISTNFKQFITWLSYNFSHHFIPNLFILIMLSYGLIFYVLVKTYFSILKSLVKISPDVLTKSSKNVKSNSILILNFFYLINFYFSIKNLQFLVLFRVLYLVEASLYYKISSSSKTILISFFTL